MIEIADKSRADYMRTRREGKKTFSALIDKKKAEAIEERIEKKGLSKTSWLESVIDEELKK